DSVTIASGTTISDAATQQLFLVNNASAGVSVTLPHANVAGKFIRVMGTAAPAANTFTVAAQGADRIFICENGCGRPTTTTRSALKVLAFSSDGIGHWYQVGSQ